MEHVTTLLLARHFARLYGENESTAIRLCARNLLRYVKGDIHALFRSLALATTPEFKRTEAVKKLETAVRVEGLL